MLAFYTEEDIQVIIILRKQQIAEYLLYLCNCFQIICHQTHRSGVGHVTTKINIQSAMVLVMAALTDIPINNFSPIPTGPVLVM